MSDTTLIMASVPWREALRERALASASAQTLPFAEVLVGVDDNREGPAVVRNRLLAQVRTEFVAVLDDDDYLLSCHNEALSGALTDAVLAYAGCRVLTPSGERTGAQVWPWLGREWSLPAARALRRANFIPATVVMRTAEVLDAGGYQTWHSEAEDYSLLLELLKRGHEFVRAVGGAETWVYDMVSSKGERADGRDVKRPL